MIKTHTVICGTSKSRNEDGYYIKEKEKFWGTLYTAGITNELISPYNYKKFEELGFKFKEIIPTVIPQDKYIKVNSDKLIEYVKKFSQYLDEEKPNRVLFHGKKAADWFLQFKNKDKVKIKGYTMTRKRKYGFQSDLNFEVYLYILPSTSGQAARFWDQEIWMKAWKDACTDIK